MYHHLDFAGILHFAENLASPLDWSSMGLVDVNICTNALVDHNVVVMPVDPELVMIMVGIFNCPNAIKEITDWYKVCIIVFSC